MSLKNVRSFLPFMELLLKISLVAFVVLGLALAAGMQTFEGSSGYPEAQRAELFSVLAIVFWIWAISIIASVTLGVLTWLARRKF